MTLPPLWSIDLHLTRKYAGYQITRLKQLTSSTIKQFDSPSTIQLLRLYQQNKYSRLRVPGSKPSSAKIIKHTQLF